MQASEDELYCTDRCHRKKASPPLLNVVLAIRNCLSMPFDTVQIKIRNSVFK